VKELGDTAEKMLINHDWRNEIDYETEMHLFEDEDGQRTLKKERSS
jgi:hypothetical protein